MDPLSSPGRIDLTAHVNFDHASSVARSCGFEVGSITDQYHFLVKAAEPWLLEIEKIGEPNAETVKLLRQFKMLFHPSVMGQDFKSDGNQRKEFRVFLFDKGESCSLRK